VLSEAQAGAWLAEDRPARNTRRPVLASPCPRTIDEPIRVLGLDREDWALAGGATLLVYLVTNAPLGAAALILSVLCLRLAKRGQPPGALIHAAWLLGMSVPGWPPAPPPQGQAYSAWR
jgi:hypothetical protein